MRRRLRGISNVKMGAVALVIAVLAVFFGFTKGIPGLHHYTVRAVFGSANNLLVGSSIHPGSPVRIAGVNVGSISGIERGPGNTALVSMSIDADGRPVHQDATAKIRPRLFLGGNFFVDLRPGSPSEPEISDGGTIPITQTAQPVALYQVLDTFDTSARSDLRGLVKEYANVLDKGGAEALNRSYKQWPGAFRNLAEANQATLGTRAHDLSQFIAGSGRTAAALASRDRQLADLVTTFDRTVSTLASRREQLGHTVEELDGLLKESPPSLRAVDRATGPLSRFSQAARKPLEVAPPVLDATLPFLDALGRLVEPDAIPPLLDDLRPTLASLATLEPKLDQLFGLVAPVSACVRDHVVPVLNSKIDDGQLSTGQTVWEMILHAAGGLASSSQNFDGNGFATRYSFGIGPDVVSLPPLTTGLQRLFGLGAFQGSRPAKPKEAPPFVANVPCATQQLPDLHAETHEATGLRTVASAGGAG